MDPKDGDSDQTCWRGAAVLAGLESARELWIRPAEWSRWPRTVTGTHMPTQVWPEAAEREGTLPMGLMIVKYTPSV